MRPLVTEASSNIATALVVYGITVLETETLGGATLIALGTLSALARYWIGLHYGARDSDDEEGA